MNKQKLNEPAAHKEDSVEKRRRFIKGAGLAAPVVLTLSSPSVFGAAGFCLSQVMSGNTSHVVTGSCTLGNNPSYWKNPANKDAWKTAGFKYGTKGKDNEDNEDNEGNKGNKGNNICSNYSDGTKFKNAFIGSGDTTMQSYVCTGSTSSDTVVKLNAYLVAALLNASTPNSNYIYTAAQVRQLQAKTLGVPPNNSTADADVLAFLISTMNP